jgi:hypothetical protein
MRVWRWSENHTRIEGEIITIERDPSCRSILLMVRPDKGLTDRWHPDWWTPVREKKKKEG